MKGQGHESQTHCRRGSVHSCECWRLLVDIVVVAVAAGNVLSAWLILTST